MDDKLFDSWYLGHLQTESIKLMCFAMGIASNLIKALHSLCEESMFS